MTEETSKRIPNILDVLLWPSEKLKKISEPVTEFDKELENIATDMFATMKAYGGVGLAAPQVGILKQLITIHLEENNPFVIINPVVTVLGDKEFEWEEGCLSVPGYFKHRKRPKDIAVEFKDLTGEPHNVRFNELYAFAVQHEVEHLNGKCFVDHLSRIRYPKIKNKIKKQAAINKKQAELARIQLATQGKL